MTQRAPDRSRQSYRHEAFLWHDPDDYASVLTSFIEEGLDLGESVLVATIPQHTGWLEDALPDEAARQVTFVDMSGLGANPARIIPAWHRFVAAEASPSKPVRGIGEPIWPGRRADELLECQLHEALLNVAIDPEIPLWLLCPYDAEALEPEVLDEAQRSHPVLVEAGSHRGSPRYAGRSHIDALFRADLREPDSSSRSGVYTAETVHRLPRYANLELYVAGLPVDRAAEVAEATHALALDSLHRGSPEVSIRIWGESEAVICEVSDRSQITDPLHGRTIPASEHDSLWRLNQVCDLVQLRSTGDSTTVRVLSWR